MPVTEVTFILMSTQEIKCLTLIPKFGKKKKKDKQIKTKHKPQKKQNQNIDSET